MYQLGKINIKEKNRLFCFCAWVTASFISVLTSTMQIYYIVFLVQCILMMKEKHFSKANMLQLALYSCLLPNNYIPIVFCLIECLLVIDFKCITRKNLIMTTAIIIGFIMSVFVNFVPVVNVFFSLVYTLPSILILVVIREHWNSNMEKIARKVVDEIFWILFFSTIANLTGKFLGIYRPIPGDDWSTGTFGDGQGNPLFMIIAIIFLMKMDDILSKRNIKFAICALIMLVASHSYVLLAVFIVSFLIGIVFQYGVTRCISMLYIHCYEKNIHKRRLRQI